MSTVERQLREYFDAGVERISVDDVMAQAAVREERLEPLRTRRSLKPAWAAVGAFAATIVAIGGVVALLAGVQHLTGKVGVDAAAIVDAGGETIGIWLVAAVAVALAAATVTWLIRRSSNNASRREPDQGKVMVMRTIEQAETDAEATKQQSRWPMIVIAVLAVTVVGLVAWMVFAMRPNSPNAAPTEVVELMEEYTAAWNSFDADALEAVVTPSYRIRSARLGEEMNIEAIRTELFPYLEGIEWHNPITGPYYAVGSPDQWFVSTEGSGIEGSAFSDGVQWQNGVFTVVRVEGELRVREHFFYAED